MSEFERDIIQNQETDLAMFNDFYKWSMFPVVAQVCKEHHDPIVTFAVSFRELGGSKAPECFSQVMDAKAHIMKRLQSLVKRTLYKDTFDYVYSSDFTAVRDGKTMKQVYETAGETLEEYCNKVTQGPIIHNEVCNSAEPADDDGMVKVRMYESQTLDAEGEGGTRLVIDAVGPYYAVTWLETSLMQAVYRGLKDKQLEDTGMSLEDDFIDAMERCKDSCDAWKEARDANGGDATMFLFSGRRTLGSAMLAFQIAYMSSLKGSGIAGTSSVAAHKRLSAYRGEVDLSLFKCAGTHAHELSMVLGALYQEDDERKRIPYSQLRGHMMFRAHHYPEGKIPFLPDTLGTMAFVEAAKQEGVYDHFGTGRQDSGSDDEPKGITKFGRFKETVGEGKGLFASEIDTSDDLEKAFAAGYKLFGAGGFFGDSTKTNLNHKGPKPPSMAVKAVRVEKKGSPIRYCVKFGDPTISKLEIDATAEWSAIRDTVVHAYKMATFYKKDDDNVKLILEELNDANNLGEAKKLLKQETYAPPSHTPTELHKDESPEPTEAGNPVFPYSLRGNFYVTGGIRLIKPIQGLMKACTNLFMSIDSHPADHISFDPINADSPYAFPAHCRDSTVGQCIVRTLYDTALSKGAKFFDKGCNSNLDSFGASAYLDDCNGNQLKQSHLFCTKQDANGTRSICRRRKLTRSSKCDLATTGSFLKEHGTSFDDLYKTFPKGVGTSFDAYLENSSEINHVYVCGLAGDWCVLDTVVNIAKNHHEKTVSFLVDFTAFSIIPEFVIKNVIQKGDRYMQMVRDLDGMQQSYLNHPLVVYGLLEEHPNIRIVVGGSKETRDTVHLDAWLENTLRPGKNSESLYQKSLEDLERDLKSPQTALFVIDMQNDFALPSEVPPPEGGGGSIRELAEPMNYDPELAEEIIDGLRKDMREMKAEGVSRLWGYAASKNP